MNSETNSFWDLLSNMSSNDLLALCFFVFLLVMLSIVMIAASIVRMHKNRLEVDLKRELVDRGFSADEIAKFVATSAAPSEWSKKLRCAETAKDTSRVHG